MQEYVLNIVRQAKEASRALASLQSDIKDAVLDKMAQALIENQSYILEENKKDLSSAVREQARESFIDRITLNEKRVEAMSRCLRQIADLPDPVGMIIEQWSMPNGLSIKKVSVPIGVILMVYEARPNVTSDSIGLMFKSSNAGILRGGAGALNSNLAIARVLKKVVRDSGIDFDPVFIIERTEHEIVDLLLKENEYIDLVIPRGGEDLIRKTVENSRIPVIKHYKGICSIFVDSCVDVEKAVKICVNAKVQRPAVCNAVETILVHKDKAREFLPRLKKELDRYSVQIRADAAARAILTEAVPANEEDWSAEYLDLIVAIKVIEDVDEAIKHINFYGSHHTDSIISEDSNNVEKFVKEVDSACCFANISTRFSDGYEFGFGAEIGISTDKLHARGPMGLRDLTTYKYIVYGNGQIRE